MKKWLVLLLLPFFVMSHNAAALELTQDVSIKQGSFKSPFNTGTTSFNQNCSWRENNYMIIDPNADLSCQITNLGVPVPDRNDYAVGDYITQTLYFFNVPNNNSLDGYFDINHINVSTTGYTNIDLVDVQFESFGATGTMVTLTSRVFIAGNLSSIQYNFNNGSNTVGITLQPYEFVSNGITTIWSSNNVSGNLGTIVADLADLKANLYLAAVRAGYIYDELISINNNIVIGDTRLGWINDNIIALQGQLDDISDNTQNVSDYVDEQRQAYENMQDTDGLVQIGDQSQALGIVGSVNSFLGGITATNATNCIFAADFGNIDLGNLDMCNAPTEVRNTIGVIGTLVFAVIDVLIAWSTIKYIIGVIDWARRN